MLGFNNPELERQTKNLLLTSGNFLLENLHFASAFFLLGFFFFSATEKGQKIESGEPEVFIA